MNTVIKRAITFKATTITTRGKSYCIKPITEGEKVKLESCMCQQTWQNTSVN